MKIHLRRAIRARQGNITGNKETYLVFYSISKPKASKTNNHNDKARAFGP
jgi:hypothetical protein